MAPTKIQSEGYDGWEIKKHDVPNLIRFVRAGDWVVFGWGQDEPRLENALVKRIKASKRPVDAPKNYLLDATLELSGEVADIVSVGPFKPARIHLVVEGRKDFLRPQMTVKFAEPLKIALDRWNVPTNTIRSPIVSFCAARGIAPILNAWQSAAGLGASGVPNQLFIWAGEQVPFETCIAAPLSRASNHLEQLQPRIIAMINSNLPPEGFPMRAEWSGKHEVTVKGLPIAVPYLGTIREPSGDFLMAGLIPSPRRTVPLPKELIAELSASDKLVYYDWELMEPRLKQWKVLNQIKHLTKMATLPDPGTAAQKWLDSVAPKLGNCATKVTLDSPDELTLVRNSPIGFTAAELTVLGDWLDAKDFPLGNHHESRPSLPIPRPEPGKDNK